jgi:hypothetical protein
MRLDMEEKLNLNIKKYIRISICASILFVIGIPLIPVGFSLKLTWLAIIGIILTGSGFYAVPILWSFLPTKIQNRAIILAIVKDNILDIKELAANFNYNVKKMKTKVFSLINSRTLEGFKLNPEGTALIKIETKKEDKTLIGIKCEFCGAPLKKDEEVCSFCNTLVRKK